MMELLTDNRGNCCLIGFTNFMQCTRKKNQELMMQLLNDREKTCRVLLPHFVNVVWLSDFGVMFYASFFSPLFLAHRAGCCLALSV